ncbi:MAG: TraB/GumN family protein [Spirosomataceae bacterium]|jgi:uncharacterized protein YbaP (TraB family)
MKKNLFIILFAFGFFASRAQSERFLYEISGNGLTKPSYLFGTFHIICKSDSVVNMAVKNKILLSDQVFLELDMDDPKMPLQLFKLMRMEGKLADLYSESDYNFIKSYLKDSAGIQPFVFEKTKPLLLYSLIINKLSTCEMEVPENVIMGLGKKAGKEILGLETVEYQMGVFDKIPLKEQANYFLESIRDKEKTKREFETIRKAYVKGNLDEMMEIMEKEDEFSEKFKEDLLEKRNQNWIPVIEENIRQKSSFIGVGAGHLGGNHGLIKLLEAKGYTINKL